MERAGRERADAEGMAVCRESLQQGVLDDDRETERDEQRGERAGVETALQDRPLCTVAEQREDRWHEKQRPERICVHARQQRDSDIRSEHREVAVREVDDADDAEQQRQPASKQREQPAQHQPLDDRVYPDHVATADPNPKYAASTWSAV